MGEPFRRDLTFAVGDHDDIAAFEFFIFEQRDGGIDRRLKIGAATGEVFGHLEDLRQFGLVAALAVEIEDAKTLRPRRKEHGAKEAALAARDIHQSEADRLGPQFLVALHRGADVDTDDHRPFTLLLVLAQAVLQDLAFEQTAQEIGAQSRVVQRDQLGRNQAAQFVAAFNIVGLGDTAIERAAAQRACVLLETADQPRQLAEPLVARQMASEFEPFIGRGSSALAELDAEVVTILRDPINLFSELRGPHLHPLQLGLIAVLEVLFNDPGLLIKLRFGDLGAPRRRFLEFRDLLLQVLGCGRIGLRVRVFLFREFLRVLQRCGALLEVFLLML